jgi:hypothetical protein
MTLSLTLNLKASIKLAGSAGPFGQEFGIHLMVQQQ